ncbi:substrate-binding periplasmic protein [Microtetraspora glauca]|uniref:Transporter substrate-binding domain-containing protein n=1 Tax=Microtetraspora glauca TaxID=1996 RepID=A0ABV3GID3_MICGL
MSIKRFAALLSTITVASVALVGCSSEGDTTVAADCKPAHTFSTVSKGTLTVGVTDMPPQVTTTGEGGMGGIDADIIRLFAKAECTTITVQTGNSAAVIPGVQQGRSDVALGGWNRTKERSTIVSLSDPLYIDPLAIISAAGTDTIKTLEGKTVGTVDGYNYVPSLKAVFGDKLKLYPTPVNMAQDLDAGRIDAAVDGAIAAAVTYNMDKFKVAVAQGDDRVPATQEAAQGALVFNLGNAELTKAFNEFLAGIRKDGTLAGILKNHNVPAEVLETGDPRLI